MVEKERLRIYMEKIVGVTVKEFLYSQPDDEGTSVYFNCSHSYDSCKSHLYDRWGDNRTSSSKRHHPWRPHHLKLISSIE